MSELKPCPFCGVRGVSPDIWMDEYNFWRIACGQCGSHSGCSKVKKNIIEAWNTRAKSPENEIPKLNDELLKLYRINEKLLAFLNFIIEGAPMGTKTLDWIYNVVNLKAKELLKEIGEHE